MADIVSKILVRQGTDVQRRTANSGGIIFSSGEPAYCTDTKRLFIGDGTTKGGTAVGSRNLGIVNQLFGSSTNGFTSEAINLFNNQGASVGDFLYDKATRNIYSLSAVTAFPPLSTNLAKYDSVVVVNTDQFQLINNSVLTIKNGGVRKEQLYFDIVDGASLEKTAYNQPIRIKANGVQNYHFSYPPAFTIKGNSENTSAALNDIFVYENHLVGRTSLSTLTSIPFSTVVGGGLNSDNGVSIDSNSVSLDLRYFRISPDPVRRITFVSPASAFSDFYVNGSTTTKAITINGNATINTGALVNNSTTNLIGNTTAGVLRVNTNLVVSTILSDNTVTIRAPARVEGRLEVNSTTTNSITGNINLIGGINASSNSNIDGTLTVTGDIIAFYTSSDLRLKEDLNVLQDPLDKINSLVGYEFKFNSNSPSHLIGKRTYGLIAQDVQKVLPLSVEDRADGYKGVNYESVIPLLVESIKELQSRVERLQNEIRKTS
jgi:hypothetical protein